MSWNEVVWFGLPGLGLVLIKRKKYSIVLATMYTNMRIKIIINHSFKSPERNKNIRTIGLRRKVLERLSKRQSLLPSTVLLRGKLHSQISFLGSNHYWRKVYLLCNFYSNGRPIRKAGLRVECYTCNVYTYFLKSTFLFGMRWLQNYLSLFRTKTQNRRVSFERKLPK